MITIKDILDSRYVITNEQFKYECKQTLDENGILILPNFIMPKALQSIRQEGLSKQHLAYYTKSTHNIYLCPHDSNFSDTHIKNFPIESSKGCITDDYIDRNSSLRILYDDNDFREFLGYVLGEVKLHNYADSLSSINLHYAKEGQELGWHYDNSSFAITLLIQKPQAGGEFQYVRDVRDADVGDMAFAHSEEIVNGEVTPSSAQMEEGTLVLFRGRNSIHRVTPTIGNATRMLAVLAYNSEPNISLSESARMTFYGRLR